MNLDDLLEALKGIRGLIFLCIINCTIALSVVCLYADHLNHSSNNKNMKTTNVKPMEKKQ